MFSLSLLDLPEERGRLFIAIVKSTEIISFNSYQSWCVNGNNSGGGCGDSKTISSLISACNIVIMSSSIKQGASRSSENDARTNNNGNNDKTTITAKMLTKKRSFTQKLAIQRQVYHEMTSFRKFPLQEMAIRDVEENLKDYLNAAAAAVASGDEVVTAAHSDSDDSDDDDERYRRQKEVVANVTAKKASSKKQVQQTSQEEINWREQFTKEFLREKSMPVVVMTNDYLSIQTANNTNDDDVPTLTQEMENFLPFLDAAIERHWDGYETDSSSTDSRSSERNEETCSQINDKENVVDNNAKQNCVTFYEIAEDDCQNTDKDVATNSIFIVDDEEKVSDLTTQNTSHLPILWSFEPRLFAMETALHGKRRYVSAHLGRFMDHYWRECDVHNRHFYELIRESTPCRLYFDLEFNKQYNPHLTTTITEDLLTELFDEIQHQFQLFYSISIHRSGMVDLDSSTAKKFSRHWIMHLPEGLLFDDARAAGIFVKAMVSRLEKERESGVLQAKGRGLLADNLFANAEEATKEKTNPKLTCIIDLGVYTRNRLFRLLGSKKFGKTSDAALRIAESNQYPFPKQFDNTGKMTAVETHSASDSRESGSDAASFEKFCNSMNWEAHAEALAATLVVPANSGKIKFPTLPHPAELLDDDEQRQLCITPRCGGSDRVQRGSPEYGESPFPKLDQFIVNSLGKRENLVGQIGTWTIDYMLQPLPQTICYNMRDNRFCENVQRAHKSNNIMWNVHLRDRVCWQTCHGEYNRVY